MKHHILIVDKDPRLCALIREMLEEERNDATIETAGSGSEALLKLYRRPADVLIADWEMPDIDGTRLVEKVQALRPQIRAVLLTTADQEEIRERRRQHGLAFTAFTKPFSIDRFLNHIDRLLSRHDQPTVPAPTAVASPGARGGRDRRPAFAPKPALSWS